MLLPALCYYPRNRRCSGLQDGRSFTVDQTQLDETSHGLREALQDTNTTKIKTFSPEELKTSEEERSRLSEVFVKILPQTFASSFVNSVQESKMS